jgi:hypothetical protein
LNLNSLGRPLGLHAIGWGFRISLDPLLFSLQHLVMGCLSFQLKNIQAII